MEAKKLLNNVASLSGIVEVPGDKSISHRAVMFGSIAAGKTTVENFLPGDDCLSTISCFRNMGVPIKQEGTRVEIDGTGLDGLKEPEQVLDVGNSGTTIRLIMGILAGRPFNSVLTGDRSIARRPMTRVTKPLTLMGAKIAGRKGAEFTPISVAGGSLAGMEYKLPVASAQVKSAILLAGLQADGTTTIIEPEKTRDHTERMIMQFGGRIETGENTVTVTGGQQLRGTDVHVPGDISSAAFFLVAGAITPNSMIELRNVGLNPTRTGILDVLVQMGANVEVRPYSTAQGEPAGDIIIRSSDLKGTVVEGDLIPRLIDEIPVIALLATQAEGKTVIKDAQELKVKETNRIDTVVKELGRLGADIKATEDGMVIYGRKTLTGGTTVSSHEDHRIGMMLAVAALICPNEVFLERSEAVSVSYPSFFEHLQSLMK
ncbi:3-phosphoshikimate 1-carboxyvinyltransferase [Bacillus sp. T33-2]|uniref:3-phosphoshikimate 1-carboxyvinyltransferase n=1 Tax=Bacillus sp. T33-2 TaxID=2054168 RepID=UPI000C76FCDA|nr:3-phosphoshikimate 1-carboxyvinyltransferase [Bacillus sp. T33-2]PLR99739.1 3-phosphoshikimate 1-carboxyvinyltransferase [Bacillus sp. T33-2]